MVTEPYKGYFISGALSVHPFSPNYFICGSVYVSGRGTSIVGVTRFQLQQFTVEIKELAKCFGLEIARMVVDKCLPERKVAGSN